MYLLLILSLAFVANAICREIDRQREPLTPLTGACQACNTVVESGWLSCPHCRTLLRTTCRHCGQHHDRWGRFCPWCGVPGEGEHA